MNNIALHRPDSPDQICDLLGAYGDGAVLHAGGTDLVVRINKGHIAPKVVIDLGRLANLAQIEHERDGWIRIGCMACIADVLKIKSIRRHYRALYDGLAIVGSAQIRNRATVAGNICNASPAADSVPPLMVLNASITIRGRSGARRVAIDEFFKGPGETVLAQDEFVQSIDLPPADGSTASAYLRLGRRNAVDCAIVGVAVALEEPNKLRAAFGSVGPTPIRARALEKALDGGELDTPAIRAAATLIDGIIAPINDVRASQDYRRAVARTLFVRAVHRVLSSSDDRF